MSEARPTVFLLIGENGEYEQRSETVYGVFSTRDAAEGAMERIPEESARLYAEYERYGEEVKIEAAQRGAPYVGYDFADAHSDESCKARHEYFAVAEIIEKERGPSPDFFCKAAAYCIVEIEMDKLAPWELSYDLGLAAVKE